jgi:hypothetical protein
MKSGVTYISVEEFLKVAKECGCKLEGQAGFHKVTREGAKAILYVSKTKNCGRVDISQTVIEGRPEEFENLGGNHYGKVHQRLNFGGQGMAGQDLPARTKEQILATFKWLCTELHTFSPLPAKERNRPVALKGSQPKPESMKTATTPATPEVSSDPVVTLQEEVAKRAKLYKTAADMKSNISPATAGKLTKKIAGIFFQIEKEKRGEALSLIPQDIQADVLLLDPTVPAEPAHEAQAQ